MGVERIVLEDHRDIAIFGGNVIDQPIANVKVAFRDLFEAGNHPQNRSFATARWTNQNHEFAIEDFEIHILDDFDITKALRNVFQAHRCHMGLVTF